MLRRPRKHWKSANLQLGFRFADTVDRALRAAAVVAFVTVGTRTSRLIAGARLGSTAAIAGLGLAIAFASFAAVTGITHLILLCVMCRSIPNCSRSNRGGCIESVVGRDFRTFVKTCGASQSFVSGR